MKNVIVFLALFLSACAGGLGPFTATGQPVPATVLPKNPYVVAQQTIYGAKGAYEAALTIAVAYAELPRCKEGSQALCSKQDIVDQVVKARDVTRQALGAADSAAQAGVGTEVVKTSTDAADAALRAFVSLSNSLARKK